VPYPFAHPAAVLPLVPLMGRFAVPSALAIGSITPDLWHLVPFADRADSHSAAALLWFCLPAGLLAYALFHLLLKQPLIALLWPRLGAFACKGFPRSRWYAVVASLLVGALTHLVWDAITHANDHTIQGPNWFQHANTALGSAILGGWIWGRVRRVPALPWQISGFHRGCVALAIGGVMAIFALNAADSWPAFDRQLIKSVGIGALQGLAAALLVYSLAFRRKILRRAAWRA
jgi:Domain of unknown function (DUF4184)